MPPTKAEDVAPTVSGRIEDYVVEMEIKYSLVLIKRDALPSLCTNLETLCLSSGGGQPVKPKAQMQR